MTHAIFAATTLVLTLASLLLALEAALRILDWPAPGIYQDAAGPLPLLLPGAEGGAWRAYPGRARLRHWDYDISVHVNRDGFLDREVAPKGVNEYRVGLFGDSFAAGMGVSADQRFGDLWWRATRRTHPDLTVYNFGSAWSGTGQSAAFLESHAETYQLDEVILAVYGGNELIDNVTFEQSRQLSDQRRKELERRLNAGGWRDWLRNRSRAAGFLYVTLSRGLARRQSRLPRQSDLSELWGPTGRALEAFVQAADGRPVSIWYLPSVIEWNDAAWAQAKDKLGLSPKDRRAVRDAIRAWAESRGVIFLDVTPALENASAGSVIFPNDGHWNARGHKLVAEYLARRGTVQGLTTSDPDP